MVEQLTPFAFNRSRLVIINVFKRQKFKDFIPMKNSLHTIVLNKFSFTAHQWFQASLLFLGLLIVTQVSAQTKNGFDLSNASISSLEVFAGGPPRDGIPSIDNPKFISVNQVNFLKDDDIVIGLVRGDVARAYPTRILIQHEIVNDVIGGDAVAVTYCPLCNTSMVFERNISGKLRTFGVSGLLYQSDVLMFDRETESLWSQLAMASVSGKSVGTELTWLPSQHITWKAWKQKYPNSQVLSTDTGFRRNYNIDAYASYFASDRTMFSVPRNISINLKNKAKVIGVIINNQEKAYPIEHFPDNGLIEDQLGGEKISLHYDDDKKQPTVLNSKGEQISSVVVFWFAWQAFYPKTEVWALN